MTQTSDRRAILGTLIVLCILGLAVGMIVIQRMQDEPIATMGLEVEEDGQSYCADFIAFEKDENKIEITITNCGKTTFLVDSRHKGGELAPEEEYGVVIKKGDEFTAVINTPDGKSIGSFAF